MRFTLDGREYDITREEIERKMLGVEPDRIQQLAAEVNGVWYPVRQVLGVAVGRKPTSLNSGRSIGLLARYGFRTHDIVRDGRLHQAHRAAVQEGDPGTRLSALQLAVATAGPGAGASDVIAIATEFLTWVVSGNRRRSS